MGSSIDDYAPPPRAALVTGGGRRIGATICRRLAAEGFRVAVHYNRSRAEAEALAAEIGGVALAADLAEEGQVAGLVGRAAAALGPLGVLVNNASTFERDRIDSMTRASWDHHLEPNLRAPAVLIQAFAAQLPADRQGAVVNLLDQRVWNLTPDFLSYTVSKVGLWALTQTLALALAPRIRVNGIGPGPAVANERQTAAHFAAQQAAMPLGRGTTPQEIAAALSFILAMPAMTGQMLALDGGQHLCWAPPARGIVPPE